MFQMLLLSLFLSLTLYAKQAPFFQLKEELTDAQQRYALSYDIAFFTPYISDFNAYDACLSDSERVLHVKPFKPKRYLSTLRRCKTLSNKIERYYIKAFNKAIDEDDKDLFRAVLALNPPFLEHRRFSQAAYDYYKNFAKKERFKAGDNFVKAFEKEDKALDEAMAELALYEANQKILEYDKARFAKDKDGKVRTFFIGYKKFANRAVLIANNQNPFSVSVMVSIKQMRNYLLQESLPLVVSIAPKSEREILHLRPKSLSKKSYVQWHYSWIMGDINAMVDENYLYAIPLKPNKTHKGRSAFAIDFGVEEGSRIYAARAGTVIKVEDRFNQGGFDKSFGKYANYINIAHSDGTIGRYYHLKQGGVMVHVGQQVNRGDFIGLSGNTGYSSGPHLHFEVSKVVQADDRLSLVSIPIRFKSRDGIIEHPKKGDVVVP